MVKVHFTENLKRHAACPTQEVQASTVAEALQLVFEAQPKLGGYVLDDQGCLRHHMNVFVDGVQVLDRVHLTDPVTPNSTIYVMQALSGG